MQIFLQRFKALFFSAGTLLGLALGIMLGILLPQPYGIGWLAMLGWILIPIALVSLYFGYDAITNMNGPGGYQWPQWAIWGRWSVVVFYALLLVSFGWCSYRTTRQSGSVGNGLLSAVWVELVTLICAIIPFILMSMWVNQVFPGQAYFITDMLFFLQTGIEFCVFVAIPLLFLALLAGLFASWLAKVVNNQHQVI